MWFARTAWFGSNWGLRMDAIIVSSSADLVKFIVAPAEVLSGRVRLLKLLKQNIDSVRDISAQVRLGLGLDYLGWYISNK